jgi:hypothetical protein
MYKVRTAAWIIGINLQDGARRVCPGYERIETISIRMGDGGPKV